VSLASVLLAVTSVACADVCTGHRCDTEACPCGCECGTATDPGLCYAPSTHSPPCDENRLVQILVTGATGRTGALLYHSLRTSGQVSVRALVRSLDKARRVLRCTQCNEREGIFVGNVNDTAALARAALGVRVVAVAVGVGASAGPSLEREVEYTGVQNQLAALTQIANREAAGGLGGLRIVLCSSMGTSQPPPNLGGILFWKLNAEAFVASAGVPFAILKPCGLLDTPGNQSTLLVGHDDSFFSIKPPVISRADVAAMMHAAVMQPTFSALRFDICSKPGPPPLSTSALLEQAALPWQR